MEDEQIKKVDESWKEQAAKDKKQKEEQKQPYHEPTFSIFLSSLSMQAMIALGRLDNPVSGKVEKSLEQARFLIDTLGIIKEKTKGNLTSQEENLLGDSLFNLRMMYIEERNKL